MKPTRLWLWAAILMTLALAATGCGSSSSDSPPEDGDSTEVVQTPYVALSGGVAVKVGETIKVTAATVNATDAAYTWTSSDTATATVTGTGAEATVTGVAKGEAVLTATGATSKASGRWGVYVYDETQSTGGAVHISGIVALEKGKTATLTATTEGMQETYTWASSDAAKATVDTTGLVTALAKGEVTITATGAKSKESATWGMYIYEVAVPTPSVTVTADKMIVAVDGTLALHATTANGTDSAYTWEVSDATKASVDASGVVTGLTTGEVIVTARGQTTQAAGTFGLVVAETTEQETAWKTSGHADATGEPFTHWNDAGAIDKGCAKCHSTPGFLDYLGADGSSENVMDADAKTGTVIGCTACHNAKAIAKHGVTFASGKTVDGLGASARCIECHQGVAAGATVDAVITAAAVATDDTVSTSLKFTNVHYLAAGAVQLGTLAKVGYEYAGKTYDGAFLHREGKDTCITCHDPHSGEVDTTSCTWCHGDQIGTNRNLHAIRAQGSLVDYDGNGTTTEGIAEEIDGLKAKLLTAMQHYAVQVAESGILYDGATYPYWFVDTNGNGQADSGEIAYANAYTKWTGRLLKAAYNYQFATKDPGAFVHNAKYVIELLSDSIADLNGVLTSPVDMAAAHRVDAGHFAATSEAWRHWDADSDSDGVNDGVVPNTCSRCHSAEGLPFEHANGVAIAQAPSAGLSCYTCHDPNGFARYAYTTTAFPSGQKADLGASDSNLCAQCHQGRESTVSVNTKLTGKDADTIDTSLSFINVHYMAAGATLAGTLAKGGYEYTGKTYPGRLQHVSGMQQCSECHDAHNGEVKLDTCKTCHTNVTNAADLRDIRSMASTVDIDADGNTEEGIAGEIDGLRGTLMLAMQSYATTFCGKGIAYNPDLYPYFVIDADNNGIATSNETARFNAWTPRLLEAAYNLQFSVKDAGAYAHNPDYIIALLYDSINDLATKVTVNNLASLHRGRGEGHFASQSDAYRHWDTAPGTVSASCARCHSSDGFVSYAATGLDPTAAVASTWGMNCDSCHTAITTDSGAISAERRHIGSVTWPGGTTFANTGTDDSFLCYSCHMGRESGLTVNTYLATNPATLSFKNVHYLPAAGILKGSSAHTGYEYAGKTYATAWTHTSQVAGSDQCTFCHRVSGTDHAFAVSLDNGCRTCHPEATDVAHIRQLRLTDYNGNSNLSEPLAAELGGMGAALYATIRVYAHTLGTDISYDLSTNPYWFVDANSDGVHDIAAETTRFGAWDAKLLKAAYNYHLYRKEPGAWAHNTNYMAQLLYDSLVDLGADPTVYNLHRP